MIVAECECCRGQWWVAGEKDPAVLEGMCLACMEDRDVEKPLTFRRAGVYVIGCPSLPKGWLA